MVTQCLELGFAQAGIADAAPSEWSREFRAWLDAGEHGSMAYLARDVETRADVGRWLEGAKSVVMVVDVYARGGEADDSTSRKDDPSTRDDKRIGRIARYARGRDYHRVMLRRLHALADALRRDFPDDRFRAFVDTSPVMERELAMRAGLGWIGKHTLLLHPSRGSFALLGGVAATLDLSPPADQCRMPDHCGTCTRCIDACPTHAITPYHVNASRCVSYLTIEHRGPIPPEHDEGIGDWIFGCDVCQEVCPHNRGRDASTIRPEYAPRRIGFDLLEVLGWDEGDRRSRFARSAMKRATLAMMKRNATIAAGNHLKNRHDPALRRAIEHIAWDAKEDEMVRATARRVLMTLEFGRPAEHSR